MGTRNFTDLASFLSGHCFAQPGTNGIDLNAPNAARVSPAEKPVARFQQQRPISDEDARKQRLNVMLDTSPLSDVVLPPPLVPPAPVNGSRNAAQFFLLDDKKTGVLALGSFSDGDFNAFLGSLLTGLLNLKSLGATQLVVDVVCPLLVYFRRSRLTTTRVNQVQQWRWIYLCSTCEYYRISVWIVYLIPITSGCIAS